MKNCEKFKNLIQEYIENLLPNEDKKEFEEHLNRCEECSRELQRYQKVDEMLSNQKIENPPQDFVTSTLSYINKKRLRCFTPERIGLFAAAVVLLSFGIFLLTFGFDNPVETLTAAKEYIFPVENEDIPEVKNVDDLVEYSNSYSEIIKPEESQTLIQSSFSSKFEEIKKYFESDEDLLENSIFYILILAIASIVIVVIVDLIILKKIKTDNVPEN